MSKTELRKCKACNLETEHFKVITPSATPDKMDKKTKIKTFIFAFIASKGAGPLSGFVELRDAHLICSHCGDKIIENYRGDIDCST